MAHDCLKTAIAYVRRGWCVIPIRLGSKNPGRTGWERLRLTEAELSRHFGGGPCNIGVLLGAPSNWLVDVDLDHKLAEELAHEYLPKTDAIFGRAGKRRSHYLYIVSQPVETRQWRLPDREMVVELRSTGGQTLFPGSLHPNGERIQWDCEGQPATVAPLELLDAVQRIFADVCRQLNVRSDVRPNRPPTNVSAPQDVIRRARKYLAKLPPAISGCGGHDATFYAACRLTQGFGLAKEQALTLLREWNERCQPPWTERELVHKVEDSLTQAGWRGYLLAPSGQVDSSGVNSAIARANRHAIEHRRKVRRRAHA